jgi:hypothetical protein
MVMKTLPEQLGLPCAVAASLSCTVLALVPVAAIQHLSILPVYMCAVKESTETKEKSVPQIGTHKSKRALS